MNIAKLGEVAEFINGGPWKEREYVSSGIPVARVSDFVGNTISLSNCKFLPIESLGRYSKHILTAGDLVVATVGSHPTQPGSVVGRPVVVPMSAEGALLNQNAVCIRPASNLLDKTYLSYVGQTRFFRDYITAHARGAANQVRMSIALLKEMKLELPAIGTQREIADVLLNYDRLIENNLRRIKILEGMAQTLYREWFVHFRFPGHKKIKGLDNKLPQGWETKKIGNVIELAYGRALKAKERAGGLVPVFGSSGIIGFHDKPLAKGPGIIIGRKGNVGSVFWTDGDFYPIDTAFFVRTELSLPYVFYNLRHQNFINNDAAVPGLSRRAAYLKSFVVPDIETLKTFEVVIMPIFSLIRVMREMSANLRHTRDLLLPKLVSGETLM